LPLSSTVSPLGWFSLASLGLPSMCPIYPSEDPASSFGLLSVVHTCLIVKPNKNET